MDVLKLTPTPDLTQNEIDAASLVRFNQFNPQEQPKLVWPAAFPVARAYLDQIVRDNGLPAASKTERSHFSPAVNLSSPAGSVTLTASPQPASPAP